MRLFIAGITFVFASLGFADTIMMKDGSVIKGTFLGGTARQIRVDDGSGIQTLDVTDVKRIEFGGMAAPPPPPLAAPPRAQMMPPPQQDAPPAPSQTTVA